MVCAPSFIPYHVPQSAATDLVSNGHPSGGVGGLRDRQAGRWEADIHLPLVPRLWVGFLSQGRTWHFEKLHPIDSTLRGSWGEGQIQMGRNKKAGRSLGAFSSTGDSSQPHSSLATKS
jgi:hypothetical protein